MLAIERRKKILQRINQDNRVIVSELSREFDVSTETIRRDLDKLMEEGYIVKSYGGAVLNKQESIDLPFNIRWKTNAQGKQAIAELVCREIQDGESIFLDASTTAVFIAKAIKQKKGLVVITNSIEILLELSDMPDWTVIATAGTLRTSSMSLVGKKASDTIGQYNADKVFLSCKGVDLEKGMTEGNEETASIKQCMMEAARKVYLAVDSTKFDRVEFSKIGNLDKIDCIVTDKMPNKRWLEECQRLDISCLYPSDCNL